MTMQSVSETSTLLDIVPLSPALGAEVRGIDLAAPLDAATVAAIKAAWLEHLVLLFRGQDLDQGAQVRFARNFGTPTQHIRRPEAQTAKHEIDPNVMLITNIRENGRPIGSLPDGELNFHSDSAFLERPLLATVLYSVQIPSVGGNTRFANMYAVYDALPDDLKRRLAKLSAVNVYDYNTMVKVKRADRETSPVAIHPVVRRHDETGRLVLYVNRLMTEEIVGLPEEESDALLERLFAHIDQPQFIYEHVWRPGDLLIWDNRSTQHARTDFPASETRVMRRVGIEGDRPQPA